MKKWNLLIVAGLIVVLASGCGQEDTSTFNPIDGVDIQQTESVDMPESSVPEEEPSTEAPEESLPETDNTTEDNNSAEGNDTTEENNNTANDNTDTENGKTYADNFAVDAEAAAAFANRIKDAVANKDLEELADLSFFPMYVRFSDGGQSVETKEDFITLGADKIFTDELLTSIAEAPTDNLSASRAGFILTRESGGVNIVFSVINGKLAVQGINY